jgi:hypothetical protein
MDLQLHPPHAPAEGNGRHAPPADELAAVKQALARSELLRAAGSVRRDGGLELALGSPNVRPLRREEVARLEVQGNTADDWARVKVADGFEPRAVQQSCFHGDVVLGRFTRHVAVADGLLLPAGVYRSTVANSVVGNDALVRDVKLLHNHVVGPGALVFACGSLTCDGQSAFGNGSVLSLAIESGGREVPVYAEIDVATAALVAKSRGRTELLAQYNRLVADYAGRAVSPRGILERGSVVRETPRVHNCYLGPHAVVDGATHVTDSTLLSCAEEPARVASGACVSRSLLQWGSTVETLAIVEHSVLAEHAHADRHAKVTDSVIGPNTGVAEGEVTASLLGPFVGFHHQALLIAALWPEGKGNVAHGANIGSNHTSRAPDQEFWPGEGTFFGLGANVKYPADFTRAPYMILSSGVTLMPQRVTFPFSLISPPTQRWPHVSTAFNEIQPAWVLSDNLFMLKRREANYRLRNKARRAHFDFTILRPDTVDLMRDACRRLEAVADVEDVYTGRDIPGLGKNYMLDRSRRPAIAAYRFHIRYYALLGLEKRVRQALEHGEDLEQLLTTPCHSLPWEHQRRLLVGELGVTDVVAGLRELPAVFDRVAADVERAKAKDDTRGREIIDDYETVHVPAAQDKFVRQTWDEARRLKAEVAELLDRLGGG